MKSIQIDREGYLKSGEVRIQDEDYGQELFKNLRSTEQFQFVTEIDGEKVFVEPFDEPLVAQQVYCEDGNWQIQTAYGFRQDFEPEKLSLDEWDRFHGVTSSGVPFVFSRKAQAEFFNMLEDYDDESITVDGRSIIVKNHLSPAGDVQKDQFWSNIYQTEEPGWELNAPTPVLVNVLPQLKLSRQRVLVLGCGSGNDAAFFAEQGHIVTAVDFSHEAIGRAQKKYSALKNLKFIERDVFNLPVEWEQQFDLVFEHTCFCAIDPTKRNDLVQVWRRVLAPTGFLLGIFFVMYKTVGPPFGASEWEIEQRLKKHFRFLYWTRTQASIPARLGKELVVFAQKL